MKTLALCLTCLFTFALFAQSSSYPVPKSAPKFSTVSKNVGPKPGSKAPEGAPDRAVFKRIFSKPSKLRILVRANCGTRIGEKALIDKAKSNSLPTGPVAQLDWERIRGESVLFWAVSSSEQEVITIDLKKENGRYISQGKKRNVSETWDIQQVIFPVAKGNICVEEKKISHRDMRVALINFLNNSTLRNFRKSPDAVN